ncbi:MAG: hypothetical protein J6A37_01665 [Oscillospiraceae bacterium]|nr:hypothetical protein [Oscillospiraceae bacterium]
MSEYKNIYNTDYYQNHRNNTISFLFNEQNKKSSETLELNAEFTLKSTEYTSSDLKTAYLQELISPDGTVFFSWHLLDNHDFTDFTQIFTHSDKKLYLIYKEDLYGYSVLRISDRKSLHYIPQGTICNANFIGESFIMTDFHYCAENNYAAAGGCYWAYPYDVALLDFTDPLNAPKKIPVLHNIIDPANENDALDDIDFVKWENSCLIAEADSIKEYFRFTPENLRLFLK